MTIKKDTVTPSQSEDTESLFSDNLVNNTNYQPLPNSTISVNMNSIAEADSRAKKRFFSALLWGIGIWMFMGFITSGIIIDERNWRRSSGSNKQHPGHPHGGADSPHDSDHWVTGEGKVCNSYQLLPFEDTIVLPSTPSASLISKISSYHPLLGFIFPMPPAPFSPSITRTAKSTYDLPITHKDILWFLTEGIGAGGDVELIHIKEGEGEGRVEVEVKYTDERSFEDSRVCMVEKGFGGEGEGFKRGIEIYVPFPRYSPHHDTLSFHLKYYLPSSLTKLSSIQMNVANFAVLSSDLSFPIIDNAISIITSNSPITFEGNLIAKNSIKLRSSNGAISIKGTVGSTQVMIESSNSPIIVGEVKSDDKVELNTSNGPVIGKFTISNSLILTTSSAEIEAAVVLLPRLSIPNRLDVKYSTSKVLRLAPDYKVTVTTSNGKISVVYLDQPMNTYLDSEVTTSNSEIIVSHHPQFEGQFTLANSNAPLSLLGPRTTNDPSGLDRKRILETSTSRMNKNVIKGSIGWEGGNGKGNGRGDKMKRGKSTMVTSNGKIVVVLL